MNAVLKTVHAATALVIGVCLIILVLEPTRILPGKISRAVRAATMMLWARWMMFALGLRRCVVGRETEGCKLYVANHVSWVDILVLMATKKGIFVAKADLASWPLIGWMCKRTGTLFLRRGSARALGHKIVAISRSLVDRESVFCFPEGTTTKGDIVQAFYPGLFQAAIDAGAMVQPVALAYLENGAPSVTLPYIGDDDFLSHFMRFLKAGPITAHICILPVVHSNQKDRREIATTARNMISSRVSELRTYHTESMA